MIAFIFQINLIFVFLPVAVGLILILVLILVTRGLILPSWSLRVSALDQFRGAIENVFTVNLVCV